MEDEKLNEVDEQEVLEDDKKIHFPVAGIVIISVLVIAIIVCIIVIVNNGGVK